MAAALVPRNGVAGVALQVGLQRKVTFEGHDRCLVCLNPAIYGTLNIGAIDLRSCLGNCSCGIVKWGGVCGWNYFCITVLVFCS